MDFKQMSDELRSLCRQKDACKDGYADLLQAKTVPEILSTMKHHWEFVWSDQYNFRPVIRKYAEKWFKGQEDDFHAAGVYVNEPTDRHLAIVTDTDKVLRFDGRAKVYVFGKAHVICRGNCSVYSRSEDAEIEMYDNTFGVIEKGKVWAYNFAQVQSYQEVTCYNASEVMVNAGICHDFGHRKLSVYKKE